MHFSSRQNSRSDSSQSRRWSGRLFHRRPLTAVKERSHKVVRVLGISHVAILDDRSLRRPVVVMSWQSSARYYDDKTFSALYSSTAILNSIRYRTGSQCSCLNTDVMCSHRRVPVTRRAAAFWIAWRRWTRLSVTLDNRKLQLSRHKDISAWLLSSLLLLTAL